MADHRRRLTVVDRTMIEVRQRDGWSIRAIARELGRSPGTISGEIKRHGGAAGYLAEAAAKQAAAGGRWTVLRRDRSAAGPWLVAGTDLGSAQTDREWHGAAFRPAGLA